MEKQFQTARKKNICNDSSVERCLILLVASDSAAPVMYCSQSSPSLAARWVTGIPYSSTRALES